MVLARPVNAPPPPVEENYLNTNNLHFKPICARLERGVLWASATLQQNASTTHWHGHVVRFLSKATLGIGSLAVIPIALIEAGGTVVLVAIGLTFNALIYDDRSEFLQKHSLKALSYSLNSAAVLVASIVLCVTTPTSQYHFPHALIDHILHIGSALFIQGFARPILDRRAERDPSLAGNLALNLLADSYPDSALDLLNQLQRDFGIPMRNQAGEIITIQEFLNDPRTGFQNSLNNPEDQAFVANFDLHLLEEPEYAIQTIVIVRRFLEAQGLVLAAENPDNPFLFELNQHQPEETAYQDRLSNLLRDSFLEIHRTPELVRCLNTTDRFGETTTGQDLLEAMDASIFTRLTAFTQLKELEHPILCPAVFTGNLTDYNRRRADLLAAQRGFNTLTREQKAQLIQKILGAATDPARGAVHDMFLEINRLAAPLNQGPLMTKTALDLGNIRGGNIIDARNLFQAACQEALETIGRQANND